MRAEQVLVHLRRQPFEPVRIFVSDGASYEVRHPELAAVSQREVIVGMDGERDGIPERFAFCDLTHITRIEPINGRKPKRRAVRGK